MRKVFWDDPYQCHLITRVSSVNGNRILFDETMIYDKNISSVLESLLAEYNEIIAQDAPIKTGFSDVENQRRYWEIKGFSKVPCGGTHVKSTAEVGYATLKRVNIAGGKERIEIRLVDAAAT